MLNKIVFDLETQKDFSEAGGRNKHHLLKVSVLGAYSYPQDKYFTFTEDELLSFGEMLQTADQAIGFNIKGFDFPVLQPYFDFDLSGLPALDLLEHIERSVGHRIALHNIAEATLGRGKSGTGLGAIKLWRQGKLEELKDYCRRDVEVTTGIYDYGRRNGKLLYKDFFEVKEVPVSFPEPVEKTDKSRQTSLF